MTSTNDPGPRIESRISQSICWIKWSILTAMAEEKRDRVLNLAPHVDVVDVERPKAFDLDVARGHR